MKSYTDIQQSKKLTEILPLETADMAYIWHTTSDNPTWRFDGAPMVLDDVPINEITAETLPCWCLAALLDVLIYPYIEQNYMSQWVCRVEQQDTTYLWKDSNPVDACYEMIVKLHEQNIL